MAERALPSVNAQFSKADRGNELVDIAPCWRLELSVSEKTIEKHRANLMRKLGLRTAAAVAAYAFANGYVDAK